MLRKKPTMDTMDAADPVNNEDYSWEVKANDRHYNEKLKKGFLCFGKNRCAGNAIRTSKYNLLNFLPLNLYEQYHQVHVIYFTVIVLLQCIPQISTQPAYIIVIPLICILVARGLRDIADDIARQRSDRLINNKPSEILQGQRLQNMKWKDIQVGDIVCLRKDDFVPADMILLYSTEPNSLCYVETAGIDGETNLKFRQALTVTHCALQNEQKLSEFDGLVTCEAPNARIHSFVGVLDWKGRKYPLNSENILLRDCRIRNTACCYGLVIYAGVDTKIMKNSGSVQMKRTKLDVTIGKSILFIAVLLLIVTLVMGIGAGLWHSRYMNKHIYIPAIPQLSSSAIGFVMFWGYFAVLSTLVPFFLYISLEITHATHNNFISQDLEMYHSESDTPAQARARSLSDLLGQIDYIFTDKTGTLTQNIMTFKKCCIGKKVFGATSGKETKHKQVSFSWNKYADQTFHFYDSSLVEEIRQDQDPLLREFFTAIALCHTVMLDNSEEEGLIYKAASPDEEALVTAARNFGYVFIARTQETITISELGLEKTYRILALMDFTSDRKRMSILVRDENGKIKLYTKGADIVILQHLHQNSDTEFLMDALDSFSEETLRTLCVAHKEVEEHDYIIWELKHHEASVTLENREHHLAQVYEDLECNLQLLGATAIEDKLQKGVPETIQLLKDGNMKIWMLTGDKQETAVNIAYSCNIISSDMQIVEENELRNLIEKDTHNEETIKARNLQMRGASCDKKALVITGDFLSGFMSWVENHGEVMSTWKKIFLALRRKARDETTSPRSRALVDLACQYQSVICCRMTPKQKASIVQLVKTNKNVTTLAIGDGGNDVNMLKTAHIGVGVVGKEGLQAVLASDFAVAQFAYLQNLLFFHGRLSHIRFSKFLQYYNYKTFAYLFHNIWFAFFNGFSLLSVSDIWFLIFNNLLYTFYPALYLGMVDKDMDSKTILQNPQLYSICQKDNNVGFRIFVNIVYGIYTSMVMFFIPYFAFYDSTGPDNIFEYQILVYTMSGIYFFAVLAEAVLAFSSWNVLAFLSIGVSIVSFFVISYLTTLPSAYFTSMQNFNFMGALVNTFSKIYIWMILLLGAFVSIIPSLFCRLCYRLVSRQLHQPATPKANNVELCYAISRNDFRRRSSYAFSHSEGYGKIVASQRKLQKKTHQEKVQELHEK
ncbi:phospholipid-transporting ATPase IK-like isoform X2 [Hyperolius riggenbachi]|uniref:phospholipid-transporting ATPase IK-like isoform X2 n=1 Tax=Hyperolius riggenbachi TaxID=752182 RepID=UPI0035A2F9B5